MEKIKILVVDDESRMRKLIRGFLEREGYQSYYLRCDDAANGWLAGFKRSEGTLKGSGYDAYSEN